MADEKPFCMVMLDKSILVNFKISCTIAIVLLRFLTEMYTCALTIYFHDGLEKVRVRKRRLIFVFRLQCQAIRMFT